MGLVEDSPPYPIPALWRILYMRCLNLKEVRGYDEAYWFSTGLPGFADTKCRRPPTLTECVSLKSTVTMNSRE